MPAWTSPLRVCLFWGVCGGVDGMAGLVVVDKVTLIWGRACWGISLLGGMTRLQG